MNKTKETSITAIKAAIDTLKSKGIKPTQLNVSNETKLSIRTIKRHWSNDVIQQAILFILTEQLKKEGIEVCTSCLIPNRVTDIKVNRVTHSSNRVSNSFDAFKRRAAHSTMGITHINSNDIQRYFKV